MKTMMIYKILSGLSNLFHMKQKEEAQPEQILNELVEDYFLLALLDDSIGEYSSNTIQEAIKVNDKCWLLMVDVLTSVFDDERKEVVSAIYDYSGRIVTKKGDKALQKKVLSESRRNAEIVVGGFLKSDD